MTITIEMIKELRTATGAGVLDCRKALEAVNGDHQKAIAYLHEKGLAAAAKKATRDANEGLVVSRVNEQGDVGVILEVNCETDFVARTDDFQKLVEALLQQLFSQKQCRDVESLLNAPFVNNGKSVQQVLAETIARLGENIVIRRLARYDAAKNGLVESYVHMGNRIGVLIEVAAASLNRAETKKVVHELALQVAATAPLFISPDNVPEESINAEKASYRAQFADQDKPEEVKEKIIEGKLKKWFGEVCLLQQLFIKDNQITVAAFLEKASKEIGTPIEVKRFTRFERGVEA